MQFRKIGIRNGKIDLIVTGKFIAGSFYNFTVIALKQRILMNVSVKDLSMFMKVYIRVEERSKNSVI